MTGDFVTPRRPRRTLPIVGCLLLFAVLSPIFASYWECPFMPYYRFLNPIRTSLMDLRASQARSAGKTLRIRYKSVKLAAMTKTLGEYAVKAEDEKFYEHYGFDWEAIRLAYEYNQRKGRFAHGGSTISQQVAKNIWLTPRRSLWRKAVEAVLTARMELCLPKERILELYLNVIELGDGVFGVGAASELYFHTTPDKLSRAQAAMLMASIPAPLKMNPNKVTPRLQRRQGMLLRRSAEPPPETDVPAIAPPAAAPPVEGY